MGTMGLGRWASLLAAAAVTSSAPVSGQERVVVLTLSAEGGGEAGNFAASMTRALREAAASVSGWEVHDGGGETIESRGCDPADVACVQRVAEELQASRVVFGTVRLEPPDGMRVTVTSYARGEQALSEPVDEVIPAGEQGDEDLRGTAEGVWARLAGPAFQPEPEPLDEDAAFSSEPVALRADLAVADETGARVSRSPWQDERTPIAIGLIAGGAALLAGAVYATVRVNELEDDAGYTSFRHRVPESLDVCDELDAGNTWGASDSEVQRADAVCSEGNTLSVLGIGFLAAGVLAVAGGTALLLSLDRGSEQRLSVTPQLSPYGAGVSARMRY